MGAWPATGCKHAGSTSIRRAELPAFAGDWLRAPARQLSLAKPAGRVGALPRMPAWWQPVLMGLTSPRMFLIIVEVGAGWSTVCQQMLSAGMESPLPLESLPSITLC